MAKENNSDMSTEHKILQEAFDRLMKELELNRKNRIDVECLIHDRSPENSGLKIFSAVQNIIKENDELKKENRELKKKLKAAI
jgi:hypothetical protein